MTFLDRFRRKPPEAETPVRAVSEYSDAEIERQIRKALADLELWTRAAELRGSSIVFDVVDARQNDTAYRKGFQRVEARIVHPKSPAEK